MKDLALKSLLIIPLILFMDYLLMMVIGCTTCFLGFTSNFYECTFCIIGKTLVILSIIGYFAIITKDVKNLISKNKHS